MLHPSTDIIANALQFYVADQNTTTLTRLLRAVSNLLREGANVHIPISLEAQAAGQVALATYTAESGQVFVAAYSSLEAFVDEESNMFALIERPLINYFVAILQMDGIAGIVFNPASPAPFTMQKKMMKELLAEVDKHPGKNAINIWQGDITTLEMDAVVNAANSSLLGGGGVDGAIHAAAGRELVKECMELNGCATGEAKISYGYNLPSIYIIHTVGPIYDGKVSQRVELANCYRNSLELAKEHHLHSIAFSAISTGVYGYPIDEAARIALLTCTQWLNENSDYGMEITLVAFNNKVYKSYADLVEAARKGELE
ncbi:MAG: O-acetyl-ADP-ribose deacetylase [Phascolarctobacterium sp.]|nr:O-acetyl-ADP-ribose deacetylase [Phascolarctobacterium sp.]